MLSSPVKSWSERREPGLGGSCRGGSKLSQKSWRAGSALRSSARGAGGEKPKRRRVLWVFRSSHAAWPFTRVAQDLGAKVIFKKKKIKKIINHLHFTVKFVKLNMK